MSFGTGLGDGGSTAGPEIGLSSLGELKKAICDASMRFPCSSRAQFSSDGMELGITALRVSRCEHVLIEIQGVGTLSF